MESGTAVDQEEAIFTDPESEEADERFYMKRLLMVGTTGPLSASPRSNPSSSYDKGISPQIDLLPRRVAKRPLEIKEIDDKSLIYSVRRDAVTSGNDNSVQVEHMTEAVGTVKIASVIRRSRTKSVCNGQNVGPLRRSLRTLNNAQQKSVGKQEKGKSEVIKHKHSKNRPKCKDTSSKKNRPKRSAVLSHPSRGGQQRLEVYSSPGFRNKTIKSPKTGKIVSVNSIHRRNWFGETLLHTAVIKGDVQSVEDMIKVGACVNLADNAGWTPLHEAVLRKRYTIVEILLKAGAQVNPAGYNRVTPLHDAIYLGDLKAVDLLLKHGADPLLKNKRGEAAVDMNKDMNIQELLEKYLPTVKRQCLSAQSVSCSTSCAESGINEPCQRATQFANKDEAQNSQESCEIEACDGPDAEETHNSSTETRASPKVKSSLQATPPLRDQAKDSSMCGSLVVQDQEILGSDTSSSKASDVESDITVDYIEAHSSSPGHWFLSATQDFSGPIRLVGETVREDVNTIDEDPHVSQNLVPAVNESNPHQYKGPWRDSSKNKTKRVLDGSRDNRETMARKKIRRITVSSKTSAFLDYLLNFDLDSVSVTNNVSGSITKRGPDGSASHLKRNVYDHHPDPAVGQKEVFCEDKHTSHTQSPSRDECSISLLAPCINEFESERKSVVENRRLPLRNVTHSPVSRERSLESADTGSPSLLVGVIHDQGLTCSPESKVGEKVLGQLNVIGEALKGTHSSSQMSSKSVTAQSCFDEGQQKQKSTLLLTFTNKPNTMDNTCEWSQTNIDTLNNLISTEAVESSDETVISTVSSCVKCHPWNDKLDTPTKQVQQRENNGETQLSSSQAYVSPSETDGPVNNEGQTGGNLELSLAETAPAGFSVFQASSACKKKKSLVSPSSSNSIDKISTNNRNTPDSNVSGNLAVLTCAKDNNADAEEDNKCSADSDCTAIEDLQHLKTSDKNGEGVIIQTKLNTVPQASICYKENYNEQYGLRKSSVEQTIEGQIENTVDLLDTGSSVSMLSPLARTSLCLLPALDNNRGTQSVEDDHQITVKNEEVSYSDKLSWHRRKTRKKLQKLSTIPNSVDAATKPTLKITNRILHHRNSVGETYLHRACKKGDLSLVKRLIKAGININTSDNAGWTALHEAINAGYADVVKQLLQAGAYVNKAGLRGVTPLHDAVSYGKYEIVKLLLQYGSNPNDKDAIGKSAVDLAEHERIKELLLTFKGPLVVPGELTEPYEQGSEMLTHEQMLQDNQVCKPPPSGSFCQDDIETHVKDTPESSAVCIEASIQSTLQEVERKQTEMSVWNLREPEDRDRFADSLLKMQSVLNGVFFKQQAEKFHLGNNFRITRDHEGKINGNLLDLASLQKHLLMLLQKQDELKHKLKMFTDQHCSSTISSTEPNATLYSQTWADCNEGDYVVPEHNYSIKSKNAISNTQSKNVISNTACPSLGRAEITNDRRTLSLIRKGVNQAGDKALEMALMGSCHKASLLNDGFLRDTSNKVFRFPEHSVSSLGSATPASMDFALKKVTYGSNSLWDCSLTSDSNAGNRQPTCTGFPLEESSAKEIFMGISSIHLIRDEEFLPCSVMDRYWDLFIHSEDWAPPTVRLKPAAPINQQRLNFSVKRGRVVKRLPHRATSLPRSVGLGLALDCVVFSSNRLIKKTFLMARVRKEVTLLECKDENGMCLRKRFYIEPYGITVSSSKAQTNKDAIDCTAIYQLDPVEIGKSLEIRRRDIVDLDDESIVSFTADCPRYIEARGYNSIAVTDEEQNFPLAYSLVVHKNIPMVERIIRAIYAPHNIYCIHYDQKSSKSFIAAVTNLAKCFPNIIIASKLESVQYAHVTRLNADLNCLSDLMSSEVKWKYAINLCGQDFPLRSNYELVEELKKLEGANMLESSRPTELKKQRFIFQHELKEVPYEYQKLPIRTTHAKRPPPHGIEMFIGSAYFVLSRDFVLYVQTSQVAKDFLEWSADTYSPDEHFWATLVRVPGVPGEIPRSEPDVTDLKSKTRLVKWNYLEGSLYPPCTGTHMRSVCIYGAAELRWLLNYGHWFANKFDSKVDPVLIKCLEEKLEEKRIRHWLNTVS
ncbi:hypothetical protein AOLI_G00280050 [Acnodon oligacanthus]